MLPRLNARFVDFADRVSAGMGTPLNILIWIVLVVSWTLLFVFHPTLQNTAFLPSWFTSNAYNFPLNTVTTLAELYIGFLIAAAANRVEKRNRELLEKLEAIEEQILTLEKQEIEKIQQIERKIL